MKLTTKGRYAVTAMLDLALHQGTRSVTLREIAENQKISLSYLEQLFAKLRQNELVTGTRGPGGGYQLSRSAYKISIAQIISAVDEPMVFTECGGSEDCRGGEKCLSHHLWETLTIQLEEFLSGIFLGTLMAQCQQDIAQRGMASSDSKNVSIPTNLIGAK